MNKGSSEKKKAKKGRSSASKREGSANSKRMVTELRDANSPGRKTSPHLLPPPSSDDSDLPHVLFLDTFRDLFSFRFKNGEDTMAKLGGLRSCPSPFLPKMFEFDDWDSKLRVLYAFGDSLCSLSPTLYVNIERDLSCEAGDGPSTVLDFVTGNEDFRSGLTFLNECCLMMDDLFYTMNFKLTRPDTASFFSNPNKYPVFPEFYFGTSEEMGLRSLGQVELVTCTFWCTEAWECSVASHD